ncbi:hypothetical protein [Amycolatopsis speibonae]|uniref:PE domain-containing protein n=1 Tax=Amycolatopsis speibonae TaxID=1450224 RepID=A0ABV7PAU4_9PSEU
MTENFRLDVEALEQVALKLGGAEECFAAALGELNVQLAGADGCWGDDEIGKAFEKKYCGSAEQSQVSAVELGEVTARVPSVLRTAAERFIDVDQASARKIDQALAEEFHN